QPAAILPVLSADAETYISYLATTISAPGSKPKRNLLRAHLSFLVTHFCPANASHADAVFHKIVSPFLLFSKPRQHTAEAVWDILASLKSGGDHEWLAGCASLVAEERAKDVSDAVEKMSSINVAFSSLIAPHLETLITKLKDENSHTKALGYLIAYALLSQLSGEHQIEAGHKVLDVIDVAELDGMEDFPGEAVVGSNSQVILMKVAVTKPNSRSTIQRLQLAIVALLPSIQRPDGVILNWLVGDSE
ncbi:hypothetical protein H0H92_014349, partial [Tricholoma furcatifolium]